MLYLLALLSLFRAASSTGPSMYSLVTDLGCSQPDNNQETEKFTCDGTTLTEEKYESNDCSGTAKDEASGDGPKSWTNLATCTAQEGFVGEDPYMKVTIECNADLNKATVTLCGDSATNHCVVDEEERGCLQDMCKELCCPSGTTNEAYLHGFWSEWSMKGKCECGEESALRTRKSEWDSSIDGTVSLGLCAGGCADKCNTAQYDTVVATLQAAGTTECTAMFAAMSGNGPTEEQMSACYGSADFSSISNYDCKMDCGDEKTVAGYTSSGDSSASSITFVMAMITATIWAF